MYNTTFTHLLTDDQRERQLATPHMTGYISGEIGSVSLDIYVYVEIFKFISYY